MLSVQICINSYSPMWSLWMRMKLPGTEWKSSRRSLVKCQLCSRPNSLGSRRREGASMPRCASPGLLFCLQLGRNYINLSSNASLSSVDRFWIPDQHNEQQLNSNPNKERDHNHQLIQRKFKIPALC